MALLEEFQPSGSRRITITIQFDEIIAINGVLVKISAKNGRLAMTVCGENPRVLAGRQLMRAREARTALDRIYLLVQEIFLCDGRRLQTVVSDTVERIEGLPEFQPGRRERAYLRFAIFCIHRDLCHRALRSIRKMYENFYPGRGWPGTRPPPTAISEFRRGRH